MQMMRSMHHQTSITEAKPDWRRVAFVAVLLLSWEGVFSAVLGLPLSLGRYAVGALALFGVGIRGLRFLTRPRVGRSHVGPLLLFAYCVTVTFGYSLVVNHLPYDEWLFAQYMLLPLLLTFILASVGVTWKEVLIGMIAAATICSLISIVDQFLYLPQFEQFVRGSINNRANRRMFLMRLETGLTVTFLSIWLFMHWRIDRKFLLALAVLAINTFVLFRVSESRQSMLTVLLALTFFVLLGKLKPMRVLTVAVVSVLVVIPAVLWLAYDIVEKLITSDNYAAEGNLDIRFQAVNFYWGKLMETNGFGFGVLSNGDDATNFFAQAWRTGNGYWGYQISDTGIFSALTQFGWIGLAAVVFITLRIGAGFVSRARNLPVRERAWPLAIGCYFLGSIINPWPANYFTLEWTILFGSLSWYAFHKFRLEYDLARPKAANLSYDSRGLAVPA